MRQIFLDTETTGLDAANGDRVIEIGLIEMVDRRLTGEDKHWYLNPDRSSHPEALKVHGLTDEFLADKPRFADVVDELLAYLAGSEVVIHNASFDLGFLDAELSRLKRPPLRDVVASVCDTLLMAREMYPGNRNSLDALCKRLEVDNSSRTLHGALLDAGLLAEVYVRLTRGQESLMMEAAEETDRALKVAAIDLTRFKLAVITANDEEAAAHEALLDDLDQASKGQTVWRSSVA
jgi:DNA polymerase-3 subunit epsilon